MRYHKDKSGNKILLGKLTDEYLNNIINRIKKLSIEGYKTANINIRACYIEEIELKGKDVLDRLNYNSYLEEFNKRNNE